MLMFLAKAVILGVNLYVSVCLVRWTYTQAKEDFKTIKAKMRQHLPHVEIRKLPAATMNAAKRSAEYVDRRFLTDSKGETTEEKKRVRVVETPRESSLQAQGEAMGAVSHA